MRSPIAAFALAASAWRDGRHSWRALVAYEVLFKLIEVWLFLPAIGLILSAVLARAGRIAVSNWDVLDFLPSPSGLLYAVLVSTTAVSILLLEQAGIMVLAASGGTVQRRHVKQSLRFAFKGAFRVAQLSGLKVVLFTL